MTTHQNYTKTLYAKAHALGPAADDALKAAACPAHNSRELWPALEQLSHEQQAALWARLRKVEQWIGEQQALRERAVGAGLRSDREEAA